MLNNTLLTQKPYLNFSSFFIHSLLYHTGVSFFDIFSSIFVYQIFLSFYPTQALSYTAFFLSIVFLTQTFSIIPSLWLIKSKGVTHAMRYGTMLIVAFFAVLYVSETNAGLLFLAAVLIGIQKGLYWTGYNLYVAHSADTEEKKEWPFGSMLFAAIAVIGPVIGAVLIMKLGFSIVFLLLSGLFLIASIALFFMPRKQEQHFLLQETLPDITFDHHEQNYLGLFGTAIIDIVSLYFWPLFAFIMLAGYLSVGFIGTLIACIGVMTTLLMGILINTYGAKRVLFVLSSIDSIVWMLRIFARTPFPIFAISAVQSLSTVGQVMTVETMVHHNEKQKKNIAFILQRELAFAISRGMFLLLLGTAFFYGFPLSGVFVVTAFAALLTMYYKLQ